MRFLALATDYDGTLAHDGEVDEATNEALVRCRESGRYLIMVTGREIDELRQVFPAIDLFHLVVAENGALLYNPATGRERLLGDAPPPRFVERLRAAGVSPLSVGRTIVATREPHETTVLAAIRDLGLERQVIFNKGAVMILPSGVDKATGLRVALDRLNLSAHNVVGVGDAENDHAFFDLCECSVAVSNALPSLKEHADLVTEGARGAGVVELIDRLLADDLRSLEPALARHQIPLGVGSDGELLSLPAYGASLLVAAPHSYQRAALTSGLLDQLSARDRQFCVLDTTGTFIHREDAVTIGDPRALPTGDEVCELVRKAGENAVVDLRALPVGERPRFVADLLACLRAMRQRLGHPHWVVVGDAHALLPAVPSRPALEGGADLVLLTDRPAQVAPWALSGVETVVALGGEPQPALLAAAEALGHQPPSLDPSVGDADEVVVWSLSEGSLRGLRLLDPAEVRR